MVWGFEEWYKLGNLHSEASKYAVGAQSNTTTDAMDAKVGRVSFQCQRHTNIPNLLALLSSRFTTLC